MFQTQHLLTSLAAHCPQMKVHASLDDLYDRPTLLKPLPVSLDMLTDQSEAATITTTTDTETGIDTDIAAPDPAAVRARFEKLYDRELPRGGRRYPVRVDLQTTPFAWPAAGDDGGGGGGRGGGGGGGGSAGFRRDFGRLLRVREDVRVLAASGLYNLAKQFGVPVDPRRGVGARADNNATGTGTGTAATATADLLGVHLRTERDVLYRELGFPDYEAQAFYFLNRLEALAADGRHRVMYLASGLLPGDDDVRKFRGRAAGLNATVVTKRDVLGPDEVTVLNNHLTWDQRALVDYEIMLRVGFMMGVVESSFAWNLAMRRGDVFGGSSGVGGVGAEYGGYIGFAEEKPWDFSSSLDPEMMIMWRDRRSTLYGRASRAVSMFNGIWP